MPRIAGMWQRIWRGCCTKRRATKARSIDSLPLYTIAVWCTRISSLHFFSHQSSTSTR
jgi:hypothetical protein